MARTQKAPLLGSPEWKAEQHAQAVNGLDFTHEPNITSQSDKDNCDLNTLIRRMTQGQIVGHDVKPIYADVTQMGDFRDQRERIRLMGEYFDALPAETRELFGNDPANLVEALGEPELRPQLEELGILAKEITDDAPGATPPPPPAPPSPPATTPGAPAVQA